MRWSLGASPPKVKRLAMLLNTFLMPSPSSPVKMDGSEDISYVYSPATAHISTIFP